MMNCARMSLCIPVFLFLLTPASTAADQLQAGAAKVDITNEEAGPVNGRLHARALVLKSGETTAVIVTMDVVSIGEIGHISNDFLSQVREQLKTDPGIPSANIIVNASHDLVDGNGVEKTFA